MLAGGTVQVRRRNADGTPGTVIGSTTADALGAFEFRQATALPQLTLNQGLVVISLQGGSRATLTGTEATALGRRRRARALLGDARV